MKTTLQTQLFLVIISIGIVTAFALEFALVAWLGTDDAFRRSLEGFDAILPVLTMGLAWLFVRNRA